MGAITPVSMVIEQQTREWATPEPSVVTDAMLREWHGQRRLFPRTEKEAELEQAIRDWKEGRDG